MKSPVVSVGLAVNLFRNAAALAMLLPLFWTGLAQAQEEPPPVSGPVVVTDKSDYAPGTTADISGTGFQPGETVTLQVLHADGTPDTGDDHAPWTVVADAGGAFQATWHVCEDDCLGSTLKVTALGQTSGLSASAYFTDACPSGGGELDLTFDPGSAPDDLIYAVALQPDGKVLIGGIFTRVNSVLRNRIARLNADGSTDFTFLNGLAGANSDVKAIAVQPDGKILIGGLFGTVNGVIHRGIARLNSDGSLDTTFLNGLLGVNTGGEVDAIALQPDGKVVIVGTFGSVNGTTRTRLARLNTDGSVDTTFQNGMTGANSTVSAVALQTDGKVVIGGTFTLVNGDTRNRIARLNTDGSTDSSFQNGMTGANSGVNTVALQPDGKVLVGGIFANVNGVTRTRIARLNTDGSTDGTFQNGMAGANATVLSLAVQPDGRVLIGGNFATVNGVARGRIARLNSDGSLDATFQNGMTGVEAPTTVAVYAIALQSDGKVLIGGQFIFVNDVGRNRIARLNTDGSLETTFQNGPPGPDDFVHALALQSDGKVLIGGEFTTVNGVPRGRIARLNSDGSLDTTFQNGMAGVAGTGGIVVYSVAVQVDGKVLIGGRFSNVNGVSRGSIARLNSDGSLDTTFQNGLAGVTLTVTPVASIVVQPDGKVLIGGFFTSVNSTARTNIARLNSDGSLDTTFQNGMAGVNGTVFSISLQPDSKVVIGGNFNLVNGVARGGIARLNNDGSLDTTFQNGMAGTVPTFVNCTALQADGKVLIGGQFNSVNTVSRNNFARLNNDGSYDGTFLNGMLGPNNRIEAVLVQPDGKLLIGGLFTLVNGVARVRIARLNTDGSLDTAFQNGLSGANDTTRDIALQPDGKVLVAGEFVSVNGIVRECVARLIGSGTDTTPPIITCPANQIVSTAPGQCSAVVNYPAPLATDECSTPTVSCVPASGSSFPKGSTTVNCTATDTSGNTANCSFTVTVNDTEPPTATCPAPITVSTAPGACDAVVTYTATASDNCPGASISCAPPSGSSFPKGSTTVNCTATDTSGNTANCSFIVTVNDTEAPTATCPSPITANTALGACDKVATYTTTASDNCPGASISCAPPSGSSFPKGSTTVNCTATDTSGNTANCSFTVTVNDTEAPTATCPSPIIANTAPGACDKVVTYTATASDNCPGASISCAPPSGSSFPKGSTTVNCTATDTSGNTANCSFTVTVNDTEAPTATCPSPITANTAPGACDKVVTYTATASDNCPGASISCAPPSGSSFPKGSTTVNCTATDTSGNTANCSFTVTVNDTEAPTATCPSPITANTAPGACDKVVTYTATASDNCPGASISCAPPSSSSFPKGSTTVNCTATDTSGNTANCSFTVTVNDTEAPTATCPSPITANTAPGACDKVVTYSASASDNCPGASISCVPASGSSFPKGSTTVNCTATDTSGNTANCSFTVTVNDTEAPTATCPSSIIANTVPGACDAVVTYTATASDNCPGASISCVPASGSNFPKGSTTVNCTATDTSGNTANCSFTVTVNDTEAPTATCPSPITANTAPDACDKVVTYSASASDNCPGASISCVPGSGSSFPKGSTTVNCTATDTSGNTANCSFTVTVNDTEAPTATCPSPITANTAPGACDKVVTYSASASDNCPGASISCVPGSGSSFPKGSTTVNCTATDTSGNTANCSFTVTVNDTELPTISCPPAVTAPCTDNALEPVNYAAPVASDNCGVASVSCVPPSGSNFPQGTTTVTCTATDTSGNSANCTFTITRGTFSFAGFLQPIDGADATGGSYASPVRTFKLKSIIPVKFLLSCAGSPVSTGIHTLQAIKYSSATSSEPPIDATPTDGATPGNEFRLTSAATGEWHFNLDTKAGFSVGTWKLVATMSDGSQHEVWIAIKK